MNFCISLMNVGVLAGNGLDGVMWCCCQELTDGGVFFLEKRQCGEGTM